MKLRQNWMTDNEYFDGDYPNNLILDDAVRRFETQRDQSLEGRNAIIDGIEERVVLQMHTNMLNQVKYDYKIHCNRDSLIHRGSIVNIDDKDWLVVSKIFDNLAYKTSSIIQTNNILKILKDGILHEIPCVIESAVQLYRMGVEETKYLQVPESTIFCYVPNNDITASEVKRDNIYRMSPFDNYKVVDVDRVLMPGILVLKLEHSQEAQEDYIYTIKILNGEVVDIQEDTSLQLNVNVYINEELVSPTPPLIYETTDDYIIMIDDNGLITAFDIIDSCEVIVRLASDESVMSSIFVNVIEEEEENITYELIGASDIYHGYSEQYVAKKFNNGVLVPDAEFTFSILGDAPASVYTLEVDSDTECTITANQVTYNIILRAADNENGEFVEKNITLRNLF